MYLMNVILLIIKLFMMERLVSASHSDTVNTEDFLEVYESEQPVKYIGLEISDLTPQSKIVRVQISNPTINGKSYPIESRSFNVSKQSQDFNTHQEVTKPSTNLQETLNHQSSNSTISISTTSKRPDIAETVTTTTSTTEPSSVTESSSEIKVIRQGKAISCGEANSNGNSNNKLVQERIVGGRKSEPGEFPFQVRLNIRSKRGSGICGGVVFDENHILTAAHCVTACSSRYLNTVTINNSEVQVTLGDHSIKSSDGELEVEVATITPHENYDACNYYSNDHDIALIKIAISIVYKFTSDGYGSINRPCIPVSKDTTYEENEPVIVSGWGVTRDNSVSLSNILRFVQVSVVNITRCQETYGNRVTKDHVCAGFPSGGKDSCQGDSGGPLVRVQENRYELVGIVSFGFGCGQPGAPGVYTRVASYVDWIKTNL